MCICLCSCIIAFSSFSEFVVRSGMNSCNVSEDETTQALHNLYKMPISEGQNNVQIHGTEIANGVSSTDALQYGLNHKMSSSDMLSGRGKKHIVKEKTMLGINNDEPQFSNSAKTNVQVFGKNRSLNGINQHPSDLNPMKKMSSSKHLSKLDNMIEEKHVSKDKEKQVNGGTSFILELLYCYFRFIFVNKQLYS